MKRGVFKYITVTFCLASTLTSSTVLTERIPGRQLEEKSQNNGHERFTRHLIIPCTFQIVVSTVQPMTQLRKAEASTHKTA